MFWKAARLQYGDEISTTRSRGIWRRSSVILLLLLLLYQDSVYGAVIRDIANVKVHPDITSKI